MLKRLLSGGKGKIITRKKKIRKEKFFSGKNKHSKGSRSITYKTNVNVETKVIKINHFTQQKAKDTQSSTM